MDTAFRLEPQLIENQTDLGNRLDELNSIEVVELRDALLLSRLGGGLLRFAGATYLGTSLEDIYAQVHDRDPEGRGAHFDVYDSVLHPDSPWVGVYNLAGKVSVSAAMLPEDLAESYFSRFPDPTTEAAYKARREFTAIALLQPDIEIMEGEMGPGMGMTLLQQARGPHIIHNLVPQNPSNPGRFVKLVRPGVDKETREKLVSKSYVPLDELVTYGLTNTTAQKVDELSDDSSTSIADILTTPSLLPRSTTRPGKRPCSGYD